MISIISQQLFLMTGHNRSLYSVLRKHHCVDLISDSMHLLDLVVLAYATDESSIEGNYN